MTDAQQRKLDAKRVYDAERYRRVSKHARRGSIDLKEKWATLALKKRKAPGWSSFTRIFSSYQWNAKANGIEFSVSKEFMFVMMQQNCHYCGGSPETIGGKMNWAQFVYNGVDRVDNSKGYTEKNTVPCCEICNRAKRHLPLDKFLAWIKRLVAHHSENRR